MQLFKFDITGLFECFEKLIFVYDFCHVAVIISVIYYVICFVKLINFMNNYAYIYRNLFINLFLNDQNYIIEIRNLVSLFNI